MNTTEELKQNLLADLISDTSFDVWDPHENKFFGPTTRSLAFFGDVNEERVRLTISQILHLEELSETDPITLYLNTPGGSLTDALALYDTIKEVSCPVVVITTGLCASAGLLILSAADYKMASKSTIFFYHQPIMSDTHVNSANDMKSFSDHYDYCKEITDNIILSATKMKKSFWNNHFKNKTSFYFDVYQALDFKLLDQITSSRKTKFKIKKD